MLLGASSCEESLGKQLAIEEKQLLVLLPLPVILFVVDSVSIFEHTFKGPLQSKVQPTVVRECIVMVGHLLPRWKKNGLSSPCPCRLLLLILM